MGRLIPNLRHRLLYLLLMLLLAGAYFGLATWVLKSSLTMGPGNVTILWLPGGVALAALLIGGLELWPAIFLGAFAAGLAVNDPAWVSALIALGNLLESVVAALALKYSSHFDARFRKPEDFIQLIKVALFSACISAIVGPCALTVAGYIELPDLARNMFRWWQADALAIIFLVPLILIWRKFPENWLDARQWPETVGGLSTTFMVNQIIYADLWHLNIGPLVQNLWPMPLLIWIAVRRGTHGVTLLVAMTAIQAFAGARNGVGYFANDLHASGLLNLWAFILMISLVGIGLALSIKAQQRLKHHLESIINTTSECIKLVSGDGKVLAMNPAGLTELDATSTDQVLAQDIVTFIVPQYRDDFQIMHRNACAGMPGQLEFEIESLRGRRSWMESRAVPFYDDLIDETVQLAFTRNISERKIAEQKLNLAASVFKHVREAILITDAEANIIDVNDTFCQISGYTRDEVMGKNPRLMQSGKQSRAFYVDMWSKVIQDGFWEGEIWNRCKIGQEFAVLLTISAVKDDSGQVDSYIGLFNDITITKNKQLHLENLAHFDQLTGLPNRLLLMDRLHQAMAQCERNQQILAVAFIDLDGFKLINDENGHAVGDQVLISVAQRLKHALREADTLARLGGDEFIGVLAGLDEIDDVKPVLERLLQAASLAVAVDDLTLQVTISIGISFYPRNSENPEQLIRHADQAMYHAKSTGKNRYHLFSVM